MVLELLGLALVGFLVYLIVNHIPMPTVFKVVITVIGAVWVIIRAAALLKIPLG